MKRIVLLTFAMLLIAGAASASYIGIYNDATGSSCLLAPGFTTNVTIIQKFTIGTVSVRFSLTRQPNEFFAFNSPYTTIGNLTSDITVQYGECMAGSIVIGTATMNLVNGTYMYIHPAQGQTIVIDTDCALVVHKANWGYAAVGGYDTCGFQLPVESSTWGSVKALYR